MRRPRVQQLVEIDTHVDAEIACPSEALPYAAGRIA
jgi:hypothetical protein